MNKRTLFLVEVAVFAALALIFDFICGIFFSLPQGGSVSIAMVPVFLMAFRWGVNGGLLTGLLLGMLQIVMTRPFIAHPLQGFIDYFLAFTVVGLAGIFVNQIYRHFSNGEKGKGNLFIILGVLLGCLLRFLCHFYTGIIFFGQYAPENQPVAIYSLLYNGSYMLPSSILCGVLMVLLYASASKVLVRKSA